MHAIETMSPQTVQSPRGFRDLDPGHAFERERMIDALRDVARIYGFVPLHTHAVEHMEVLSDSGGEEARQTMFHVSAPEPEPLGLRYDLTVSLARYVAQHPNLTIPFRRYQYAPVWRADKPDKTRFREFTQFDFDAVGVESHTADVEVVAALCDGLARLDVGAHRIRMSSRELLDLLLDYATIPYSMGPRVFRVLDKLEKVGIVRVRRELTDGYEDASGDFVQGLALTRKQVNRVQTFLDIRSPERAEVIAQLRDLFRSIPESREAIDGFDHISRDLASLGYGDERVTIDLSIARGLGYYTGPIFEAQLLEVPEVGSVGGGGRYDRLVEKFLGKLIPATGASLGIDRLLAAREKRRLNHAFPVPTRAIIANLDPSLTDQTTKMCWELRRAGIPVELYLGAERSLTRQLRYADQSGARVAILYGSDEHARDLVTLKDMSEGRKVAASSDERGVWLATRAGQRQVRRSDLATAVAEMLQEA